MLGIPWRALQCKVGSAGGAKLTSVPAGLSHAGCGKPEFFIKKKPLFEVHLETGMLYNTDGGTPMVPIGERQPCKHCMPVRIDTSRLESCPSRSCGALGLWLQKASVPQVRA